MTPGGGESRSAIAVPSARCRPPGLRQAPDVAREQVDLLRGQAPGLRRHHAALAVLDDVGDRVLAPAVQPDLVGQVGRADRLVALALGAVAGGAGDELL